MFGFNSNKKSNAKPVNKHLEKAVALTKGSSLKITKTPLIKITASWTDPDKDYDLMALVLYKNGTAHLVSYKKLATDDGAVKHLGDVGATNSDKTETIEIRLNDDIDRIAPFAYSAIENGAGSFREYGVSVLIDNEQDQPIGIQADEASADSNRYTLCFGEIVNGEKISVEALELYSANHSERQPAYISGHVKMDAGPENSAK